MPADSPWVRALAAAASRKAIADFPPLHKPSGHPAGKNMRLKWRSKCVTFLEVGLPPILVLILVAM